MWCVALNIHFLTSNYTDLVMKQNTHQQNSKKEIKVIRMFCSLNQYQYQNLSAFKSYIQYVYIDSKIYKNSWKVLWKKGRSTMTKHCCSNLSKENDKKIQVHKMEIKKKFKIANTSFYTVSLSIKSFAKNNDWNNKIMVTYTNYKINSIL